MPPPAETNRVPFVRPELVARWQEIVGVLVVFLGPFAFMSARAASRGSQHRYLEIFFSDRTLLINGAIESAILGLALFYFHRRGWRPSDLRFRPGFWSSVQGAALYPLALIAHGLAVIALYGSLFLSQHRYATFGQFIATQIPIQHLHAGKLSWSVLVPAMVLNAFLEEILCMGYAFTQFAEKMGPRAGLLLIVALRALMHVYQGPVQALGIGATFLIFGLWYWRTRNLWTLIFAHALLDTSSLALFKLIRP